MLVGPVLYRTRACVADGVCAWWLANAVLAFIDPLSCMDDHWSLSSIHAHAV